MEMAITSKRNCGLLSLVLSKPILSINCCATCTATDLTGGFPLGQAILAHAEALAGNTVAARSTLDSLLKLKSQGSAYVPANGIALIHLGLGEDEQAINWFNEAFDERFIWLVYLNVDPVFDRLRTKAGFQALQQRMAFPQMPQTTLSES